METTRTHSYRRRLARIWWLAWPVIRQVLGWFFIFLGVLGLLLPVLQGVLFLVIGVALIGRRHWLLRRAAVLIKRSLRRWARVPTPVVGPLGRMALRAQHECSRQSRRLHRRLAERKQQRARLAEPPAEPPYADANERKVESSPG
jgi:hypothetical protein